MRFKKTMTVLIIFLSFLILSNAIYASEIESNENTEENNEETSTYNVNSDNSLKTTFDTVYHSNVAKHEINLESRTYKLKTALMCAENNTIRKTITINGNNSILKCKEEKRFVQTQKNITLILNNLTICNGLYQSGGAIENSGTLIINNCTFFNNTASINYGGSIISSGTVNITNCVFTNSTSKDEGSSIYINSNSSSSKNYINNCTFENNNAQIGSTVTIKNSGIVKIENSTFKNNNAPNGATISNSLTNLTVTDCKISDENSQAIISNDMNCSINNLSIEDNDVQENLIINNGVLYVNNSKIFNNTALDTCGILNDNQDATTVINNSLFQNNTSTNNKGIIKDEKGLMKVLNSKFFNNTSLDLFVGTEENFINVGNNEYLGNNLKTSMNINSSKNNTVKISGKVSADEIYNTTVNVGHIYLYQGDNLLSAVEVHEDTFNITSSFDANIDQRLKVVYDGESHFMNQMDEVVLSSATGEYTINVGNLPESFVYGDVISYVITVENTGAVSVTDIRLKYLIPDELTLLNSSDYIDSQGICTIDEINVNEMKNISINATTTVYENLNLIFNILDVNRNNYTRYEKSVRFLSPSITLNNSAAHIGDMINITAAVNNYNKESINNITFKFQYKEVSNVNVRFEDNTLKILNYKIANNLYEKNYLIEIICNDNQSVGSFSDTAMISLSKLDTYCLISKNVSNNVLNLSASLFDNYDNPVLSGSVILKINGRSVKSLKVNNGIVSIINYKIDKKYQKDEYEILLVYSGNNQYKTHRNSTKVIITEENTSIDIEYTVNNNILTVNTVIKGISSHNIVDSGCIVFKVNGMIISSKIPVNNQNNTFDYDISHIGNINSIGVFYYGSNLYNPSSLTLTVCQNE